MGTRDDKRGRDSSRADGQGEAPAVLTFALRRNVLFAFKRAPRFLRVIRPPDGVETRAVPARGWKREEFF